MKRWVKVFVPVVALGAIGFGAVRASTKGASKNGFTLVKVERGTITDKALATGQIVPEQEIQVKSQISGTVKECFAEVGDRVEVGQPLFAITPDPTPLELNEVERGVQLAEVAFAKASADFERNGALIDLRGIQKVYDTGAVKVEALRGVDLAVKENELLAIVGPSGSGKSTLMNIIGCLDTATGGSYRLRGEEVAGLSVDRLADIRNRRVGFVFQNFNLLPQLTAYENVEMPLLFKGTPAREREARVEFLFEQVGMNDRMRHRPTELSGGQMQRVAIARALACEPDIVLADEPTGNLDTTAGRDIVAIFEELWRKGHTLVLITHDPAIARRTHRVVQVQDGTVVGDEAVA